MSGSNSPPSPNRFSVLPPVLPRSKADQSLLRDLQRYIDAEMADISPEDRKQRYFIHSAVFNKVS